MSGLYFVPSLYEQVEASKNLKALLPVNEGCAKNIEGWKERIKNDEPVIVFGPFKVSKLADGIDFAKAFRRASKSVSGKGFAIMRVTLISMEARLARQTLLDIADMGIPVALDNPPEYLDDLVTHLIKE